MKQNQLALKALMMGCLMIGGGNSCYAQFGGLLKKAKQIAKEKVQTQQPMQTQPQQQQQQQSGNSTEDAMKKLQAQYDDDHSGDFDKKSDGSYWIWQASGYGTRTYGSGKIIAKWYPDERRIWTSGGSFKLADKGRIVDEKGELRGIFKQNGIVTFNAEVLDFDVHEKYIDVKIGDKLIGQVTDDGRVMCGGDAFASAGPINMRVLAYICFGIQYSNQELLALCEKREKAVVAQEKADQEGAEFAEFSARVTRMAVRDNVEKNGMSAKMDSRDYYKYEQTNYLDRGCHWVWLDNVRVCGWNPENNHLLDRDYNRLGTFSGGVLYDRWGVKYGSVQGGVVKNRHGQVVGKAVKGQFKGTAFGGKDKDFNYKLVDASGKQVGLIQTNASPDLVAAWAFCMFAKK